MKPPAWVRQEITVQGAAIAQGTAARDEALTVLVDRVFDKDPAFIRDLTTDCVGQALDAFLAKHVQGSADGGQVELELFPELPPLIEVRPGRFVAQGAMNRKDWAAAVVQADTKAGNATRHANAVRAAHDKVVPLLVDDELTTAQVIGRAA